MITVGFTGTREGMTGDQRATVALLLRELKTVQPGKTRQAEFDGDRFEHGGCVGADVQAAMIAGNLGYWVARFPGNTPVLQDDVFYDHETAAPEENLARNARIVERADVVLAVPNTVAEARRGGTWSTVRRCRAQGKKHIVVWPDGTCDRWVAP